MHYSPSNEHPNRGRMPPQRTKQGGSSGGSAPASSQIMHITHQLPPLIVGGPTNTSIQQMHITHQLPPLMLQGSEGLALTSPTGHDESSPFSPLGSFGGPSMRALTRSLISPTVLEFSFSPSQLFNWFTCSLQMNWCSWSNKPPNAIIYIFLFFLSQPMGQVTLWSSVLPVQPSHQVYCNVSMCRSSLQLSKP